MYFVGKWKWFFFIVSDIAIVSDKIVLFFQTLIRITKEDII